MKKSTSVSLLLAALILGAAFYFLRNVPREETAAHPGPRQAPLPRPEVSETPEKVVSAPSEGLVDHKEELKHALKELPTLADLKQLSEEEVHYTPEMILEGGKLIGSMIEKAEKDPARREDTVRFLKECAEDGEVVPQLRAVCWKKTITQIAEWKVFLPISDLRVPDDVRALGSKLP